MAEVEATLVPSVDPSHDRLKGGGDQAITLVEFGDYECPYSRAAYEAAGRRAERSPGNAHALHRRV